MKKLICIFASAALLGACEQRTDVVAPAASSPGEKKETNTTIVNPTTEKTKESTSTSTNTNTTTTTTPPPSDSSSTSTSTSTTTTSSPSP